MAEETMKLLEQMVQELRAVRRELAAIHEDVAPFAEERRKSTRMQSPLMGVDLFHADPDDSLDDTVADGRELQKTG